MLAILLGYILDLIVGDPPRLPHPIRGMGWLIKNMELVLRRLFKAERQAGIILVLFMVLIVGGGSFLILSQISQWNYYLGLVVSVYFIYVSLAIKDLKKEGMAVFYALERGDIVKARRNLSRIVSRETQGLGPHEIIRATVESIAENIVDGIISPLFYAFLGGAPLALGYKAVNTLDSMVGYKDDRYRYFGWASARLDDLANFIPARISVVILSLASLILGKRGSCAFKIAIRDGGKNPSPNSGIPQAAMAGALEIQLGGLNIYKGKRVLKPKLGQDIQPLSLIHIKEALKIAYLSSFLMVSFGLALWALLS